VRVEVHWDGGLPEEEAQRRSEDQASRVRRYLVERGLDERELEVAGLGRARPLPGLPRARQRRLEVHQLLP
jgi:outer membrane protein OmpA-like peptidoglycan-associated protein